MSLERSESVEYIDFDILFYAVRHTIDVFSSLDIFLEKSVISKNWYHSLWHLASTFICSADCPHHRLLNTPGVSCI